MSEPQIPAEPRHASPDPDDGHADIVDESDYADPGDFPDADDEDG